MQGLRSSAEQAGGPIAASLGAIGVGAAAASVPAPAELPGVWGPL